MIAIIDFLKQLKKQKSKLLVIIITSILFFSCSNNSIVDPSNDERECGYFDTIYKNDSINFYYYINMCPSLNDTVDFFLSYKGEIKKFYTSYYSYFSLDTIIDTYIILRSSCGTECVSFMIFDFEKGNSFEYLNIKDWDYNQQIIANQSYNNDNSVNIIRFSGDTIKTIPINFYLSYWDYVVEDIYIENNTFNIVTGDSIHYGTNKYKQNQTISYNF